MFQNQRTLTLLMCESGVRGSLWEPKGLSSGTIGPWCGQRMVVMACAREASAPTHQPCPNQVLECRMGRPLTNWHGVACGLRCCRFD